MRLYFGLLRLLHALLSPAALGRLGELLGSVVYLLAGRRRRIALINLRLCFPDMDPAVRLGLLKAHFRSLGRATLQETVSWWGSQAQVQALTRVEGLEHFTAHRGRPIILLCPHFVGLNIGGVRLTTEYAPLVTMYSHIKNPELDRLMLHSRTRFGDSPVFSRQDGIKPVLRAMKRGLAFYYLPDMDFGPRETIFVPFFGVPAATITGMPRIAKATGAVVVPCITRQEGGGYVVHFYPAWEDYPSGDVEADTRRMNAFIEDRVREMPEQYFWLHMRFKTQPDGRKGALYAGA